MLIKIIKQIKTWDKFNRSGVYKINCDDCNAIYIGKTERNFNQRYREHLKDNQSHIYQHLNEQKHHLSSIHKNLEVLHYSNNSSKIKTLEAVEIRKASLIKLPLLNAQQDLKKSGGPMLGLCCSLLK